ncbi:hypothetical protein D9758_002099 [Tetrapyrgos nigripes]|uniref:HbrB-domain-containing protein n=1 Tax=Tetrapyrgos nigripes TaxID=182062 RepID=A0A8H5GTJ6_9AGAR|nr:hypothetical protein D9758_002099 [Tetrapyrgos nigripes]
MHTTSSPSKAPYGRTYDPKLVTREMHRLGSNAPPSAPSLPNPASTQSSSASTSSSDPWGAIHVNLLPLFNREPLRVPIEELNNLVKRHISSVISASPPRAIATLENDTIELLSSGMVTLNSRLAGVDDDKLISRVVELWGFFWDQVLTYVEGSLLPLRTDPLLPALYRPKRPSSPTRSSAKSTAVQKSASQIDVRTIALRCFRDKIIVPLSNRLYARLSSIGKPDELQEIPPRVEQMLLVLSSINRQRSPTLSLTTPSPQANSAETAVTDLLRVLRSPRSQADGRKGMQTRSGPGTGPRAPSFLSNNIPRDRRGRIAQRRHAKGLAIVGLPSENVDGESGDETPRITKGGFGDMERDKGREFLEVLRNAEMEKTWDVDKQREEEEEEALDWDSVQADVERMVGMTSAQDTSTSSRRRMT